MSSQPARALAAQSERPKPPKVIPKLTDAYRKAYKNYVLASGLLAAWELIGITPDTDKWGFKLQSPNAVPLILFILVIYCAYKMWVEWKLCHPKRQKHPVAKWDYRIAHGIAFIAIAISLFQYLLRVQLADPLARHRLLFYFAGFASVAALFSISSVARARAKRTWASTVLPTTPVFVALFSLGSALEAFLSRRYMTAWLNISVSLLSAIAFLYLLHMYRKQAERDRIGSH